MATLGTLRQRVFQTIDDDAGTDQVDGTRWSLEEVDDALATALQEIVVAYVEKGGDLLDQEVTLSTTNGTLDFSSYNPLSIKSVMIKTGDTYSLIQPVSNSESYQLDNTSRQLKICYIAQPTFPDGYSEEVVYGVSNITNSATFDKLMVFKAASQLLIKDGEVNVALERHIEKLEKSMVKSSRIPALVNLNVGQSYLPYYPYRYAWAYKPHTIELGKLGT